MDKRQQYINGVLKKVSLQTVLGGIATYWGLKQSGAPENQAIVGGILSALTSAIGTAHGAETEKPNPQ